MATFSLFDLFLLLGISQGLLIAGALLLGNRQRFYQHGLFAVVMLLAVIMLVGRMGYVRYYESAHVFRLATMVDSVVFLFGPLLFTYNRRLLFAGYESFRLSWRHYIPAVLHFTFVLSTFQYSISDYQRLSLSGEFRLHYFAIEIGGLVSNTCYWLMSLTSLNEFDFRQRAENSFEQPGPKFIRFVFWLYGLILAAWLLSISLTYGLNHYSRLFNYDVVWVAIPLSMYVIGFYILLSPVLIQSLPDSTQPYSEPNSEPNKNEKGQRGDQRARLSQDRVELLAKSLEKVMLTQRPYLQSNLKLKDLADLVNSSQNDLSWFLNNHLKTTFYEFINRARVEEFVLRLKTGALESRTILELSYEVGFNSKSSFNKAFKHEMGCTPNLFVKTLESRRQPKKVN